MFPTGCGNVTSHLVKMKKLQSRVILFSARLDTSVLPVYVLALLFQVMWMIDQVDTKNCGYDKYKNSTKNEEKNFC